MTDPTDNAAAEKTTASRPYPMVLMTEREDELSSLHEELEQEIRPNTFIERMYVQDIAALLWEIIRLRRFKTATVNNALRVALSNILKQILFKPEFLEKPNYELEAEALALQVDQRILQHCGWVSQSDDLVDLSGRLIQEEALG